MANRLADQTSPYLRQHADNPVDWFPWGPDALALAEESGRPILLSIGYSACHWCHVMERESFADPETAAFMNEHFVNIKVDREERPDVDEIYMRAVQTFTGGGGGWPMTVFLTPGRIPFFGGTYFPPKPTRGMPSFTQVMKRVLEVYEGEQGALQTVTDQILESLAGSSRLPKPVDTVAEDWLDKVKKDADDEFDDEHAGFGKAPKFPPHGTLNVLLAHHAMTGHTRSLQMVTETLDGMARGGMYDLLGGGFARYSVDRFWRVPHFEKMLYDNALLTSLYADAFVVTGNEHYARIVSETLAYVQREMTSEPGGFYAAQDADSEGVEGKFFAWNRDQIVEICGPQDGLRIAELLEVTEDGTFEDGLSVLRMEEPLERCAPENRRLLERYLPRLLEARTKRVPPATDDKIIAAWNGLMISAFARAGRIFDAATWVASATSAVDHVESRMHIDGRLQRIDKDGAANPAFLDDHAFYLTGLIDVYEATYDPKYLRRAVAIADTMVELFWDDDEGGFFFTGHDAETLIARSKSMIGGALPSANGTAALAFVRLATLVGRPDLEERADLIVRSYQQLLDIAARAIGPEALAATWLNSAKQQVGIVGDAESSKAMLREVHRRYMPFSVTARLGAHEDTELLPWMKDKTAVDGPTAFLCRNQTCRLPMNDVGEWAAELDRVTHRDAPDPGLGRVHAPALPTDPESWLNTDAPVVLDDLRGQVVILDFWTYCCINCLHVLPELHAVEEALADEPVTVIGVHSAKFPAEKERENVERALRRHHVKHPVVVDSEHELWSEFAVRAWPTIVVLDTEGRVAWQKAGEVSREELLRVVRRHLVEVPKESLAAKTPVVESASEESQSGLRFPGKVFVHPEAVAQSTGAKALDGDGRLYVADSGHHRILEVELTTWDDGWPRGKLVRSFGSGRPEWRDGDNPSFNGPQGIFRFGDTLWVADTENHSVRNVDLSTGVVTTVAGTGRRGKSNRGDPSDPTKLDLRSPWDIVALDSGVLVAMAGTHQIWVYLPDIRRMGPIIGSGAEAHVDGKVEDAALAQPSGLALFGRHLFWVDAETSSVRLSDLDAHTVATIVGRGLFDFGDIDGSFEDVRLQHPLGIAVAEGSEIYVADTFNNKLKVLDLGEGSARTLSSHLLEPSGVAVADDYLIVADTGNHALKSVHRKSGETRAFVIEDLR